jgi:hypothetical protein
MACRAWAISSRKPAMTDSIRFTSATCSLTNWILPSA